MSLVGERRGLKSEDFMTIKVVVVKDEAIAGK